MNIGPVVNTLCHFRLYYKSEVISMRNFIVRGPEGSCNEIQADNLDQAMSQVKQRNPGKMVAADASEVIYVCQPNEDETACQTRLK